MKMKMRLVGVASLLFVAFSMQASTTLTMTGYGSGLSDNGVLISPYTGNLSVAGTSYNGINLYCDDAIDAAGSKNAAYTVNVTTLTSGNLSDTRFGTNTSATISGNSPQGKGPTELAAAGFSTPPVGTALYEDLAWLYTQMMQTSNNTQLTGLQEAAWDLTSNSGPQGQSSAAEQWLALLKTLDTSTLQTKTGTLNGVNYIGATFGDWLIIDDTSAAGQYKGGGTSSCNTGDGCQEFLAYFSGGSGTVGGGSGGTPEPATFGLFGSALLFGIVYARRRRASK
jgi:hypothetical protein